MPQTPEWYAVENVGEVPSPALLVFPDRVEANIRRMVEIAGGDVSRLRPHVKTHKIPQVIQLQLAAGIGKFKAATIAEAEMTAAAGAKDVLLSYQPVGPNQARLATLARKFPETSFAALVDDPGVAEELSAVFSQEAKPLRLYIDVNIGMNRTGIVPGKGALALAEALQALPGLEFAGLHVYDGHIHDPDLGPRTERFDDEAKSVRALVAQLDAAGVHPPAIVGGGSPTFGLHASKAAWECSPGTTLFWDSGYGTNFPDLGFLPAAVLLTRVISKPCPGRICLDLGHKAVAGEQPLANRVRFLNLPDATPVGQSEEHLMIETPHAEEIAVGQVVYGVPWHVCPTVALHEDVVLVRNGRATGETWAVAARKRKITV